MPGVVPRELKGGNRGGEKGWCGGLRLMGQGHKGGQMKRGVQ